MFKFLRFDLFRSISVLSAGTFLAQLIPILMQPVLRRLFPPEVFGNYAIYLGIIGIVSVGFSLRYEVAIILPRKNADAANLLALSILINFICFVCFFLVILFLKEPVAQLLHLSAGYVYWLYFVPFSVFFFSGYQAINYWLIRSKAFHRSSGNKIIRRGAEAVVQVTGGVMHRTSGMVLGDVTGNLVNILAGLWQLKRTYFSRRYLSLGRMRQMAYRYREFPLFNLFPALLNTAAAIAPVFFIKHLFSDEITGYFDLTRTVLAIPMALFSISISQALYQKLSEYRNSNMSIKGQVLPVFKVLVLLAFLEIVVLFFFGEWLFAFVFGKNWTVSGTFAQILVFSFALKFIISPLSISLLALEKIKIWSAWQIFYFVGICMLVIFHFNTIFSFLKTYVFIDIFAYTIYAILIFTGISEYEKKLKDTTTGLHS